MNIEASKFSDLFRRNKDKGDRELHRIIGKNVWAKVQLFKDSPLISMANISSMFGTNGICWARILVDNGNYYICNIAKNNNGDEQIEVTKEEIKKILTSKCRIGKDSLILLKPVELLETGELFNVVPEHFNNDDNDNLHDADDDHEDEWHDEEDWEDEEQEVNFYDNGWPNNNFWADRDFHADDSVWEYIGGPEGEVESELQLFIEPSTQGGMGSIYIEDDSGLNRFSSFSIDYGDWLDLEYDAARNSDSSDSFREIFKVYLLELIEENTGVMLE